MTIYQLQIGVIGFEWDRLYHHFFKTAQERENFKEQYEKDNTGEDGEYIPNVQAIYYSYSNKDFKSLKNTMTIAQYEQLFDTDIEPIENNVQEGGKI